MTSSAVRRFTTPGEDDLGARVITNLSGLAISLLPNGGLFAIEHRHKRGRTRLNLVEGSPLDGGIARLYLRVRAPEPALTMAAGANADIRFGANVDRFVWRGATKDVRHDVSLWLHPRQPLWLWRMDIVNDGTAAVTCDALLVQDVGLGERGFPHEQRGLRVAVHRSPYRPTSRVRAGRDEPPEPSAGWQASLGRARLLRRRRRLRHRRDATVRPGLSRRRRARSQGGAAEPTAPARVRLPC